MKKMVGALVLGAVIAFPTVLPDYLPDNVTSVACAKTKRVPIYTEKSTDNQGYPEYKHYELEPDSFGEMEIKGIHYMSFWVTEIGEYFNNFFYDKANWGSYHFLAKFYPDGSYRIRRYSYSKSDAKHRERLNVAKNWEIGLEQSTKKYGKDYLDPSNWGIDNINRAMAEYVKDNYPSLIQQNIAYYTKDKEILMQREVAKKQATEQVEKQRSLESPNKIGVGTGNLAEAPGYQRAFHVASHFYYDADRGDIYIDFDNIKDITCIRDDNVKVIRYLVPVIRHNLTTGNKKYWKYLFSNVPSQEASIWGSTSISAESKWYSISVDDWSRISPDDWYRIENDVNEDGIYRKQWLGVDGYTEEFFRNIDWTRIDYELHDDYAVLLKTLMYLNGYQVPMDTYIPAH